jgi:diguanylate cyclase (GGDEF)-like protein
MIEKTPMIALIASSNSSHLTILKKLLQGAFHLIESADVHQTIDLLKTTNVDLVLLDAKLKEGHTLPTAEQIRSVLSFEIPLLLITSNLKKSFVEAALEAGVTDFLHDPLEEEEVEHRVRVAIQARHRSKQISEIARGKAPTIKPPPKTLADRKILNDRALKEISQARKSSNIVSLLMIELDDPAKKTPDAIDRLITILQQNLREKDLLIPQASGKFFLMLPKTSQRAAEVIAETIRSEAEERSLTVSIGVISFDHTAPTYGTASADFEHLIAGADAAMQEAKKTGNKIVSEKP